MGYQEAEAGDPIGRKSLTEKGAENLNAHRTLVAARLKPTALEAMYLSYVTSKKEGYNKRALKILALIEADTTTYPGRTPVTDIPELIRLKRSHETRLPPQPSLSRRKRGP